VARVWRRRATRHRQRRAVEHALPEAVELLVLVVRAGRVPAAAIADVAARVPPPVRPAFGAVVARLERGARFADAVGALATELGPPAVGITEALAASERYGVALADTLGSLGDEARRQRRRNDEADARQLPVRLSLPLVLCTLPAFVLVAIVPLLIGALSSLDLGR
jgi:Flp pilus assembly protein TadB